MSQSSKRVAVIGGAVGVATAGVIALLVVKGKPADETPDLAERSAAVPSLPNREIEGGVVKPWEAKPPTAAELAEAAEAAKAEKAELDQEKARAEAAVKQATADARQAALDEARTRGQILGSLSLQGGAFASLTGTGDISSGFDDANIYGGLLGNDKDNKNGGFGFGRSGFGPGGGGTGQIGSGNYGTIGRGTGTGSGYGVGARGMRGRSSAVPTVSIGQPSVSGDPANLDKAIIRRYVKRNIQKIQYCYEKELSAKPSLSGTVSTQFSIAESGAVSGVTASGVDPDVASCVAGVIKGIEFPKPKGTGGVTVNYPFTFRPPGS